MQHCGIARKRNNIQSCDSEVPEFNETGKMRGILQLLVLNDNVFNTKLLLDWVNLKIQQTKGKIRHHTDKFHVKVTHVVLYRVTPVRANLYDNDNPTNSHKNHHVCYNNQLT